MFELMVGGGFAAAHNLRGYKGKCEALHGHNYKVWIKVCIKELDKMGLAVDFTDLKRILNETTAELDHAYLNDITFFKEYNPTSELIAKYIFNKIAFSLKEKFTNAALSEVQIWETDKACATYRE
ncbi:MAG: 6-carboxytetrahydropterin synthase QueD [Candidatus Omnitrophota bacterium]